jgi:hypothetical protein
MNRIALLCLLNCLTISSYAMNASQQSRARRDADALEAVKTIVQCQRARKVLKQHANPKAEEWSTSVLKRQKKMFDTFIAPEMEKAINAIQPCILSDAQKKNNRLIINYARSIQPLKDTSYFLKVENVIIAKRILTHENNQGNF